MSGAQKLPSEADICSNYITPAVKSAGWDEDAQIRCEVPFIKRKIHVTGNIGHLREVEVGDCVLGDKPKLPIATVEAKGNDHLWDRSRGSSHAVGATSVLTVRGCRFAREAVSHP